MLVDFIYFLLPFLFSFFYGRYPYLLMAVLMSVICKVKVDHLNADCDSVARDFGNWLIFWFSYRGTLLKLLICNYTM